MGKFWPNGGYSPEVKMRLIVQGASLAVSQIFGKTIFLREAHELPWCDAELEVTIDGETRVRRIFLCHESTGSTKEVDFQQNPALGI